MKLDPWSAIGGLALVAGLGFMGTAPFIADYVVIVCGLVGLGLAAVSRRSALIQPSAIMIYAALVLLAGSLPFVYQSSMDLLPLAACLPMLAAPYLMALLLSGRASPHWLGAHALPLICLFGVTSAVAMALWEAASTGIVRAGLGNNPIHFGGIITVLGYLALTGTVSSNARWRAIYLAGPALAMVGVVLSGSRGPLLAWLALAFVSLPILLVSFKSWRLTLVTVSVAVAGGVLFVGLAGDSLLVHRLLIVPPSLASALAAQDPVAAILGLMTANDTYRTALYEAGWLAFKSSPIVGVGYGQMMPLVRQLFPDMVALHTLENLHSDLADFAALGGAMGILAYFLLLLSPIAALRGLSLSNHSGLWLTAVVLVVGYAMLGLTNAMFGVLPQTVLFAVALGALMAMGQHARLRIAEHQELRR